MTKKHTVNVAESVKARLLNLARERSTDFNLVLQQYLVERFLYRLSQSQFADQFVLKGAMLFHLWTDEPHRPTNDLDLLGYGNSASDHLADSIRIISQVKVADDGLRFDPDSIRAEAIREDANYDGVRVRITAHLGSAKISTHIDIGFGDPIHPSAETQAFPRLLNDLPQSIVATYTRESSIAEKYEAMVKLGMINTRMKDFHDILKVSKLFAFNGAVLSTAIRKTFDARKTTIPTSLPLALTDEFSTDSGKQGAWTAYLTRLNITDASKSLEVVVSDITLFLWPPTEAVSVTKEFEQDWQPGGPWQK